MVTTRNQANAPIAPCMFWRRIHGRCIMNVTEYLHKEYDHARILYKNLSVIRTESFDQKKEGLNQECGTPEEERKLSFIIRTIAAARRLCLE